MNNARKATVTLIVALLVFASWAIAGFSQDPSPRQASDPAREILSTRRTPQAKFRQIDLDEKLIRDVYARLMRYQSAARDELAAREGKSSRPDDYLTFELRDLRSGAIEEIFNQSLAEMVTPRNGAVLTIVPNHLSNSDGVFHAYYDAKWTTTAVEATTADSTVWEMLRIKNAGVTRYISYQVTARLEGQKRTYRALVLYQIANADRENSSAEQMTAARPTSVEILDNITPAMNAVFKDESPPLHAPWSQYVRSARYRAVVDEIRKSKATGKELIPANAPIGYLPGDEAALITATTADNCLNIRIVKADDSELPSPFRVGVTAGGHDRSQALKAIVFPHAEASNVTIEVSAGLTLSNVSPNTSTGVITFRVVGNLPAGSLTQGDQTISAYHNIEPVFASKNVTVVVPFQVAIPHDTTGGGMVIQNRVLDATTSPGVLGLPPGQVFLTTVYIRFLSIRVTDRWNDPIGDLYAGAAVTETFGSNNEPINQTLSGDSTYLDPVGYPAGGTVVAAGSPAALAWPSAPQNPLTAASEVQNVAVQIDGFNLNPAVANRTVTAVPPNNVTITWP